MLLQKQNDFLKEKSGINGAQTSAETRDQTYAFSCSPFVWNAHGFRAHWIKVSVKNVSNTGPAADDNEAPIWLTGELWFYRQIKYLKKYVKFVHFKTANNF